MFGLSLGHLILLAVIVLLIRAKKLPEVGEGLKKTALLFKRGLHGENLPKTPEKSDRVGVQEPDEVLPKGNDSDTTKKS